MKKLIIIFVVGLLFVGCSPCKRLQRICPPEVIRERYDSIVIKDTIIYKDRIVEVSIPGDTQYVDKPILIKETISPLFVENTYASAKAWVDNSKLKLQLILKEQKISFLLDSANQIAKHWEYRWHNEKQKEVVTIIEKTPVAKVYKLALFAWVVLIILAGVYLYIKIKTKGFKSLINRLF